MLNRLSWKILSSDNLNTNPPSFLDRWGNSGPRTVTWGLPDHPRPWSTLAISSAPSHGLDFHPAFLTHTSEPSTGSALPPQLNCKGLGAVPGHSLEFPHPCSHPLVLCSELGTGSINNWSRNADLPRQPALNSSICTEMNPSDHQTVTLKHPKRSIPGELENIHTLWGSKQPLEELPRGEARATVVADTEDEGAGSEGQASPPCGFCSGKHSWETGHSLTLSHLCLSRALTLSHRKGDNETETKKSSEEKTRPPSHWLTGNPHRCPLPAQSAGHRPGTPTPAPWHGGDCLLRSELPGLWGRPDWHSNVA